MPYENSELHVNIADRRFEMLVDSDIAFINYKQSGRRIYLTHTEVPPAMEGKGVASALVEKTFRYIEKQDLKFVPLCAFVQSYLQKHPAWNRLVAEEE